LTLDFATFFSGIGNSVQDGFIGHWIFRAVRYQSTGTNLYPHFIVDKRKCTSRDPFGNYARARKFSAGPWKTT